MKKNGETAMTYQDDMQDLRGFLVGKMESLENKMVSLEDRVINLCDAQITRCSSHCSCSNRSRPG